jgi:peptidoglycan/LPS O-acetylase OafA/YrhL
MTHHNNFDFLRLAAASMVVVFHSYVLSGHIEQEPLRARGFVDFGTLGVAIFFVVSGYLVTGSYQRDPQVRQFLVKRLLRIIPGLAVVLLASAFVIGPLVTSANLVDYFQNGQTWLYPLRNILLYPVTYTLPGTFINNPHPDAVNGSLWSLRLEFTCYLGVMAAGHIGFLRPRWLLTAFVASIVAFSAVSVCQNIVPAQVFVFFQYLVLFEGGMVFAIFAPGTAFLKSGVVQIVSVILFLVGVIVGALVPFGTVFFAATLAFPVLIFSLNPLPFVSKAGRWGDFSYGLYIWAFPIQQVIVAKSGAPLSPLTLAALTFSLTLPIAALSWWFVEKPALLLKGKITKSMWRKTLMRREV